MTRKRGGRALWVFSILLWVLPARAATFVDMVGRQVELQKPPRRIIPLAPSLTEILFALGAGDSVVGVVDYADYPPEAVRRVRVGGGLDPNLEVIVELRPDLVLIAADANRWDTLIQLEQLQIPVFGVKPVGVEGVLTSIAKVGEAVGRQPQAEGLIAHMRRRIAAVSQKVSVLARPRVLYVVWIDPLIVAGGETVIDDLINLAGGANIVRTAGFPRYSLEELVIDPPDVILLALDRGGLHHGEALRRLPVWREVRPVREGAVRVIDASLTSRPGPRIVDGVELLARLLHPQAFPGSGP
ncbi:MAG: cobalamin-binding protein [candidate division NC10 bacterium]|nr:cobalamin-binding protein [candidate division NC10 bacterium]